MAPEDRAVPERLRGLLQQEGETLGPIQIPDLEVRHRCLVPDPGRGDGRKAGRDLLEVDLRRGGTGESLMGLEHGVVEKAEGDPRLWDISPLVGVPDDLVSERGPRVEVVVDGRPIEGTRIPLPGSGTPLVRVEVRLA